MDWITLTSIAFTAAATISIAVSSWVSLRLSQAINRQEEAHHNSLETLSRQHQSELRDLYQAIAIATLMGGDSNETSVKNSIETFRKHYSGKIKIFKTEEIKK